jgi:hypothetical protein
MYIDLRGLTQPVSPVVFCKSTLVHSYAAGHSWHSSLSSMQTSRKARVDSTRVYCAIHTEMHNIMEYKVYNICTYEEKNGKLTPPSLCTFVISSSINVHTASHQRSLHPHYQQFSPRSVGAVFASGTPSRTGMRKQRGTKPICHRRLRTSLYRVSVRIARECALAGRCRGYGGSVNIGVKCNKKGTGFSS